MKLVKVLYDKLYNKRKKSKAKVPTDKEIRAWRKLENKLKIKYDSYSIYYDDIYDLAKVTKNEKVGFVNIKGKEIIPLIYDNSQSEFFNDIIIVTLKNKKGGVDKQNKEKIPFVYDDLIIYHDDWTYYIAEIDNKWGIINNKNEVIIPIIYDDIAAYYHHQYKVKLNNKYGILADKNYKIKTIIPIIYDYIETMIVDFLKVKVKNKWHLINWKNEEVSPEFDKIYDFSDSMIMVVNNSKKALYSLKQRKVVSKFYDDILNTWYVDDKSNDFIAFKENSKYGFINNKGDQVRDPIYDHIGYFDVNGYAEAKIGNKFGMIDKKGKFQSAIKIIASGE